MSTSHENHFLLSFSISTCVVGGEGLTAVHPFLLVVPQDIGRIRVRILPVFSLNTLSA